MHRLRHFADQAVQAIIRKSYPLALYTYCANHCLNLALNKACTVPIIRNSLSVITELVNFFNHSAQSSHLLKKTIDAMYAEDTIFVLKRRRLVHLCETRWIEWPVSVDAAALAKELGNENAYN